MIFASILGNLLLGVEGQASLKFLILRKLIKSKKIAKKANTLTDLGPQGLDTLCVDIFSEQTIISELVQLLEHFGLYSDLHFAHRIIKLNFEFCDLGGEITTNRRIHFDRLVLTSTTNWMESAIFFLCIRNMSCFRCLIYIYLAL